MTFNTNYNLTIDKFLQKGHTYLHVKRDKLFA